MTSDRELRQLLTSGIGPNTPGENIVEMVLDGKKQSVPVSVGTFYSLNGINITLQQIAARLDGIHAHLAGRDHPKSKGAQTCIICAAQNMTPEQIEELKEAVEARRTEESQDGNVVADNIGVGADVQRQEEHEQT